MFSLRYHGGSCCGVKHIASFEGYNPQTALPDAPFSVSISYGCSSGIYHMIPGAYYHNESMKEPFPKEIAVLRLYRLLDECTRRWPAQRIEVTLIGSQMGTWGEIFKEIGFKEMDTSVNSNTRRTIHTFWLIYNQKDEEKKVPNFYETYGERWQEINRLLCPPDQPAKPAKKAPFRE